MKAAAALALDRTLLTTWRACVEFVDDRAHRDAAQIAFFVLLSFVPLTLLLVAAFGVVLDDDEVRRRVVGTLFDSVPLAKEGDRRSLERAVLGALDAAGRLGPFSILLLIVAGSGVMSALRHGINQAWDIHARPSLLRRKALDVVLILGATVILAFSLSLTATRWAANVLDDEAGGGWLAAAVLDGLGDVLPFVFTALVILFLFRVLPMERPRIREIWPGALVAALLLGVVRAALEIYFENFADLGALYGGMGALMALLIFVYAAANVVLFGAEFASEWARLPAAGEVREKVAGARARVRDKVRRR